MFRREKGLCYTCDAKFTPTHRCPNKQYMLIECEEDDGGSEKEFTEAATEPEELTIHHLSLQAYLGSPGKATIRFHGVIGGTHVQILLDGGSSDSFIHPRIAQHLKLSIEPARHVRVMVGDGNSMRGEGKVRQISVQVQGHCLQFPAYVIPIAGSDIVLGASWLATLRPHIANYTIGESYIKFYYQGHFITLKGTNCVIATLAEYHQLQRLIQTEAIAECYMMQREDMTPVHIEGVPMVPEELQSTVQKYWQVFEKPRGLPPVREHEHQITLKDGTEPVKVRPYRYPFNQKNEIEKMVSKLLEEGLIQPSTSPFSAPVILVRKKDGTW